MGHAATARRSLAGAPGIPLKGGYVFTGRRPADRALPETTELQDEFGFAVADKKFVWIWRERVDHRKPKVPNREVIVLAVADLGEKQAVLAIDSQAFFTLVITPLTRSSSCLCRRSTRRS